MFPSKFIKYFVVWGLIFLSASACRFWQNGGNATPSPTPFVAEELKSEIPFSTKEPEVFQAEFVTVANETERKTLTARNGAKRRFDFNFGAENQVTVLKTDKNYLVFPKQKIYTESTAPENIPASDEWNNFLTTEWLSSKTEAGFEKLETVDNLTKYRVLLDGKSVSEVLVYVDESRKIPVKQEFYSISGERKTLLFTFEIRNLKLETGEDLFTVPPDFKKVSTEEFRRQITKND